MSFDALELTTTHTDDTSSSSDRRQEPRIALALEGRIHLDPRNSLPCTVHDVSEHGIGISHDPRTGLLGSGTRLGVRCGDRIVLSFRLPGPERLRVRAGARVRRVWCHGGIVEMGLELKQVNPQVLAALAQSSRDCDPGSTTQRTRCMSPQDLEVQLRRVAADTFPKIADRLETAAHSGDMSASGTFFRALVQIEADKDQIAENFVARARRRLMPDLDDTAPRDKPLPLRFDQSALAAAFVGACQFREEDHRVQQVVEELVSAAGFRYLAPPLAVASL